MEGIQIAPIEGGASEHRTDSERLCWRHPGIVGNRPWVGSWPSIFRIILGPIPGTLRPYIIRGAASECQTTILITGDTAAVLICIHTRAVRTGLANTAALQNGPETSERLDRPAYRKDGQNPGVNTGQEILKPSSGANMPLPRGYGAVMFARVKIWHCQLRQPAIRSVELFSFPPPPCFPCGRICEPGRSTDRPNGKHRRSILQVRTDAMVMMMSLFKTNPILPTPGAGLIKAFACY
ncbi:ATP-dependent DNA helicase RecQ [Anopheles sinensis]|uniref:ATP-dependent DNA helicase RecQ n=1 Tax=Anopheles sinensis TaxID=74873 RepID=A0A084VIR1_ANOSI|nr:ATP-dependent DNA helicase RecQ [Anopheles sinensis]